MSEVFIRPETEFVERPATLQWRGVDQVEGSPFVEITINAIEIDASAVVAPTDEAMRRMAANFFSYMESGVAASHECVVAGRIDQMLRKRDSVIAAAGSYDAALRSHYGIGSTHPDDQNLPIDKWDETD